MTFEVQNTEPDENEYINPNTKKKPLAGDVET